MNHYEFLQRLHTELKPRGYLEIGVQTGASLRLASCSAIGIDPAHDAGGVLGPKAQVFHMTSDEFFARGDRFGLDVDLVYIDGMHLYEYALRDFLNVCHWANERTVIVFDDTHPYSQEIATREQTTVDWTGDVWKTMDIIRQSPLQVAKWMEVDVQPTGAFIVWDIDPEGIKWFNWRMKVGKTETAFTEEFPVHEDIIKREHCVTPDEAIRRLTTGP